MNRSKLYFLIVILSLLMAACTPVAAPVAEAPVVEEVQPTEIPQEPTAVPVPPTEVPTEVANQTPILELVGIDETKTLTLADLQKLPVTSGMAGIKSSTGKITAPLKFSGVTLLDLADLMGGLDETMGVNLVAEDGYSISYSYDQIVNGNYISYDPATGDELRNPVPLTAMLAYQVEGQPLNLEQDGNLRLVIISEEPKQVTDGHWSVKWVSKVEIKPLVQDWVMGIEGAITTEIDRASFESCVSCHTANWTDDKGQVWTGIELWRLMGYGDDAIKHEGWSYDVKLAKSGYDVTLVAADGFEVTVNSDDADRNHEWIVAMQVDGADLEEKNFPLKFVGTGLEKKQMVGGIATVKLGVPPVEEIAATEEPAATEEADKPAANLEGADLAIVGLVNNEMGFMEADLRALEVVTINAEHPKNGAQDFEGVRLSELFALVGIKDGATKLLVTASDGFTALISLADVLASPDCLLGFTNTPGDFKLVMPNLPSNAWVKDVVRIEFQ